MFTFPVGHNKKASSTGPGVANLVHWVSADVGVTKDGSNFVSAWADQSGNNTNWGNLTTTGAQLTWVANQINGYPIIRSPGAGGSVDGAAPYLKQNAFFATGNTNVPAEVFVVLKSNGAQPIYSWAGFSTEPESSHYPYSGGNIYENFGSTTRPNAQPPTLSVGRGGSNPCQTYNIYNISNGASAGAIGSYVMRLGGTQFYTGGPFNSGWASTFRLFASNTSAPAGFGMSGDIAEILIYSGVLNSTDRTTVYNYLQTKYNLV